MTFDLDKVRPYMKLYQKRFTEIIPREKLQGIETEELITAIERCLEKDITLDNIFNFSDA